MAAMVSAYPQVAEWIYLNGVAVNVAQIASVAFGGGSVSERDAYAVVRLASYRAQDETEGANVTWFKVSDRRVVAFLQAYVDGLLAPGFREALS